MKNVSFNQKDSYTFVIWYPLLHSPGYIRSGLGWNMFDFLIWRLPTLKWYYCIVAFAVALDEECCANSKKKGDERMYYPTALANSTAHLKVAPNCDLVTGESSKWKNNDAPWPVAGRMSQNCWVAVTGQSSPLPCVGKTMTCGGPFDCFWRIEIKSVKHVAELSLKT